MHLYIHMLTPPHTGINNTARVYPWLSPSTRPWSILPTRAAGAALTCDYSRPPPPCTAPVTPAALSSEHKHPYFRVGRIDNHIDGCTEGATRVDSPEAAIHADEHNGQEAPRALIGWSTSRLDAPRVRQLGQFREARTPLIRLSVIADPHQQRLETGHSPSSAGCAKPSWTTHAASLMTMTP